MKNNYAFHIDNDNLAVTPLENIFINVYMPRARGDYVKVYLYGLKLAYSHSRESIDNTALAELFNLTEGDVINAWEYWQKQGILTVEYVGTAQANITYHSIPALVLGMSSDAIADDAPGDTTATDDMGNRIAEMYDRIDKMYGSRPLPKKDMLTFKQWINDYGFEPEAVVILVEYGLNLINNKGEAFKPNQILNYLKTIAEGWRKEGIHTFSEADTAITQSRNQQAYYYEVLNALGLRRAPMDWEREMMDTWVKTWGLPREVIDFALHRTAKPNLRYVGGILGKWHKAGLTTLAQVTAYEESRRKTANTNATAAEAPLDTDSQKRLAVYQKLDVADEDWITRIGEEVTNGTDE